MSVHVCVWCLLTLHLTHTYPPSLEHRHAESAVITVTTARSASTAQGGGGGGGKKLRMTWQPLYPFFMSGIGYTHPTYVTPLDAGI